MKRLRWVRGATLKPTYLACGNWYTLSHSLVFHTGLRAGAEQAARFANRFIPKTPVVERELTAAFDEANTVLGIRSAFLLHTGWYKDTYFVGPVEKADGARVFVKSFANREAKALEALGTDIVARLAKGHFRTADILADEGDVLAFELLERGKTCSPDFEQNVLAMCSDALEQASPAMHLHDRLTLVAAHFADRDRPMPPLGPIPQVMGHGDCTPWNMFRDRFGSPCLVDTERAGVCSPYSDWFHFCTQPLAMKGERPAIERLLCDPIVERVGDETARQFLLAYLLRELETDLQQWNGGRRHHQLAMLIEIRTRMIDDLTTRPTA